MSNRLIIRLGHQATDPVEWIHWSKSEARVLAVGRLDDVQQLAELAVYAQQSEVNVLVPADMVILRTVEWNGKINAQTLNALPYLLEEDVASDVEQLHVVILAREQNDIHLMAVEYRHLRHWLGWLQDSGIQPQRLLPDVLALPLNQDGWSALALADHWLIRQGRWSGILLQSAWLTPLLAQWRDSPAVIAYGNRVTLPEGWQVAEGEGLAVIAAQPTVDWPTLLTGKFKVKSAHPYRIYGYLAGALLAFCCLLALVKVGLEGYKQQQKAQSLKQESIALYQQMMPGENQSVSNPRRKLQRQLQELQSQAIEPGLLNLLAETAPFFRRLSPFEIHSLRYDQQKNQLDLVVTLADVAALKALSGELSPNIELQISDEKPIDSGMSVRLIIRRTE